MMELKYMTMASHKFSVLALFLSGLVWTGCAAKKTEISYETPEKTFRTWKQAASKLDMKSLLESYAVSARPSIEDELARSSKEALMAMQKEAKDTNFTIEKIVYENNMAYIRIRRDRSKMSEIEVLTMVKESGGWKLLP